VEEWEATGELAGVLSGFGLLVVPKLVIWRPLIYGCTMSLTIEPTQAVPLTQGNDGVFRITGSRVTLDSIVHQFQSGATAEQIQEDFPSVSLGDVYAVIAWFLQHAHAVEDYLNEQAQAGAQVRREVEGGVDARDLREHLKRRRAQATV
jgi:uncharacterized protein (DUF433 family)